MTAPRRIRRSRAKGWRTPVGAVYVGRPGPFGNPFDWLLFGRAGAIDFFQRWLADKLTSAERASAGVEIMPELWNAARRRILDGLPLLRGRDLCRWCPLCARHRRAGKPLGEACADCASCHAELLFELANANPVRPAPEAAP